MHCPFCAEEIRDEAILCRFCGATRNGGSWSPPGAMRADGRAWTTFTLRSAGAIFIVSAVLEILWITSPVPLLGAVRAGPVAAVYHALYAGLFATLGAGLWRMRRWAHPTVLAGTALYTLDRLVLLLDTSALKASIEDQLRPYRDLLDLPEDLLLQTTRLTIALGILCWWGFAVYVHVRRAGLAQRDGSPPRP